MLNSDSWVNNAAHLLHFEGRSFPCDRDIEALAVWNGHALLLSSDTDCLSLWDGEGCIRTARVGVYPQDMRVQGNIAYVCGGADGALHLLTLPELLPLGDIPLPGMPERVSVCGDAAHILTLLAEEDVHTALLCINLLTGAYRELARFAGLPGAIFADDGGLWVGVSERLYHLPHGTGEVDTMIEGFGLVQHIDLEGEAVLVTDPVEGLCALVTHKPRPAVKVLYRGDVGQICFTR